MEEIKIVDVAQVKFKLDFASNRVLILIREAQKHKRYSLFDEVPFVPYEGMNYRKIMDKLHSINEITLNSKPIAELIDEILLSFYKDENPVFIDTLLKNYTLIGTGNIQLLHAAYPHFEDYSKYWNKKFSEYGGKCLTEIKIDATENKITIPLITCLEEDLIHLTTLLMLNIGDMKFFVKHLDTNILQTLETILKNEKI